MTMFIIWILFYLRDVRGDFEEGNSIKRLHFSNYKYRIVPEQHQRFLLNNKDSCNLPTDPKIEIEVLLISVTIRQEQIPGYMIEKTISLCETSFFGHSTIVTTTELKRPSSLEDLNTVTEGSECSWMSTQLKSVSVYKRHDFYLSVWPSFHWILDEKVQLKNSSWIIDHYLLSYHSPVQGSTTLQYTEKKSCMYTSSRRMYCEFSQPMFLQIPIVHIVHENRGYLTHDMHILSYSMVNFQDEEKREKATFDDVLLELLTSSHKLLENHHSVEIVNSVNNLTCREKVLLDAVAFISALTPSHRCNLLSQYYKLSVDDLCLDKYPYIEVATAPYKDFDSLTCSNGVVKGLLNRVSYYYDSIWIGWTQEPIKRTGNCSFVNHTSICDLNREGILCTENTGRTLKTIDLALTLSGFDHSNHVYYDEKIGPVVTHIEGLEPLEVWFKIKNLYLKTVIYGSILLLLTCVFYLFIKLYLQFRNKRPKVIVHPFTI